MWRLLLAANFLLASSQTFAQNLSGQTQTQTPETRRVSAPTNAKPTEAPTPPTATLLAFKEFFEVSSRALKPSAKLLSLNGKRVRIVGFMAQMELPPTGAFYLCPRPIVCDEAGGGTADLPPDNVLVVVPSMHGKVLDFTPRLLEATGVLEVGNRPEEDGRVSAIRLILDSTNESSTNQKSTKR